MGSKILEELEQMAFTKEELFYQALLNLLRKLEWSGKGRPYDTGDHAEICPICGGSPLLLKHSESCELAKMIGATEGMVIGLS